MRTQAHRSRRPRALGLALVLTLIGATLAAQTRYTGNSTTAVEQRGAAPSQSQVTIYPDGQQVITRDGQSTDISIQRRSAGTPAGSADANRLGLDERLAPRRPAAEERREWWSDAERSREAFRQRMLERLDRRERF